MAKVTITIEDDNSCIGALYVGMISKPKMIYHSRTKAQDIGLELYNKLIDYQLQTKGGDEDGQKERS